MAMSSSPVHRLFSLREAPFLLLAVFVICLFFAGGASREDVTAQVVIRAAAWALMLLAILMMPGWTWKRARGPFLLLAAMVAAPSLHLVPLPSSLWAALPGRDPFLAVAQMLDRPQPWRPLSLSPGGTLNAAASLVVPLLVLVLASHISWRRQGTLLTLVVVFVAVSAIWAVAQFIGGALPNPLMNNMPGQVGGPFANRNHLALLLAIGLLLLPVWCFQADRSFRFRAVISVGLACLLFLVVLAIGSRAGLILAPLGALLGLMIVKSSRETKFPVPAKALLTAVAFAVLSVVGFSALFDRSATIERLVRLDVGADLRARAIPTIAQMIWQYFPIGSGFGTFDPVFRISEPDDLLNPSYLNHAHNDFLEIVLEGGFVGLALLVAAIGWWSSRTVAAWRQRAQSRGDLRLAGSAVILLVLAASVTDYPARTPTIMAFLAVAAAWLAIEVDPDAPDSMSAPA